MKKQMRFTAAAVALGAAAALGATATPATGAEDLKQRSLVKVLNADGNRFDGNWRDFDIVHRVATTILAAKPSSPVAVLADGTTPLTAFVPTDRAFQGLATQVTGKKPRSEKATFRALAGLGVDTLETVLLYHVVPGATVSYKSALKADGASLTSAQGGSLGVYLTEAGPALADADTNDANPHVIYDLRNINKGNKQIAHGINRVLRPVDLP